LEPINPNQLPDPELALSYISSAVVRTGLPRAAARRADRPRGRPPFVWARILTPTSQACRRAWTKSCGHPRTPRRRPSPTSSPTTPPPLTDFLSYHAAAPHRLPLLPRRRPGGSPSAPDPARTSPPTPSPPPEPNAGRGPEKGVGLESDQVWAVRDGGIVAGECWVEVRGPPSPPPPTPGDPLPTPPATPHPSSSTLTGPGERWRDLAAAPDGRQRGGWRPRNGAGGTPRDPRAAPRSTRAARDPAAAVGGGDPDHTGGGDPGPRPP